MLTFLGSAFSWLACSLLQPLSDLSTAQANSSLHLLLDT